MPHEKSKSTCDHRSETMTFISCSFFTPLQCSGEHPSCKRCQNRGLVCEYAKEGRVRGPNRPRNKAATPAEETRHFAQRSQAGSSSHNLDGGRAPEVADLPHYDKRLTLTPSPMASRRDSFSMGEHRASRPRPPNLKLDTHYQLDNIQPDASFQVPRITQGQIQNSLPHDQRFRYSEDPATIHTASQIPISYQGIHVQTPTGIPMDETKLSAFAYEENRSPSTSSSTSMQGHHSSVNPAMIHTYLQGIPQHFRDDSRLCSPASRYVCPINGSL